MPYLLFVVDRDVCGFLFNAAMNGVIVRVHQIRQHIDVSHGFLCRKVPHSCFQRTYQAFHDRSFGFIIRVVLFNVFVFQQRLKMFVEKFRALTRNDLFGFASTTQNGFEGIDERKTRFIFQRSHPGVFGKHINAHQQVAITIVNFSHLHLISAKSICHCSSIPPTITRFLLKRRRMGLWRVYASCFINYSLIFVRFMLNFPSFFTSLYKRSTPPNSPERFGS